MTRKERVPAFGSRRLLAGALWCLAAWPVLMPRIAEAQSPAAGTADSMTVGFEVPAWPFPLNPPPATPAPAGPKAQDPALLHVPNSRAAFTRAQVADFFAPPDWHPEDHPAMPEVVAHGRPPAVFACGFCHLPDGRGRPENATVAGLPAAYIVQQVKDMASHARRSAWNAPEYRPGSAMRQVAEQASDAEIAQAAAYFSALTLKSPRAQVIETARLAKTHAEAWVYVPTAGAGDEPLGERIIEMPRDFERHERHDSRLEYVAYVPTGSIARGQELATTGGGGRTLPCVSCHGVGLRGVGLVPPIAGRSPTYLVRQLLAFRSGARNADNGRPMQLVVARLDLDDMIAVAAFAGSQSP